MSGIVSKPEFDWKNKGSDQLCSKCTADQHLCFRYTDSTIPLLNLKSEASSHLLWLLGPVCVRPGPNREKWFARTAAHLEILSQDCQPEFTQ